ncbi:SIALI-17 repeat-containing surface protein, partial [Streptococcus gordonii]
MEKRITGERFQRYSLRKLSVGLVSATIGSFFFSTAIAGNVSTIEAAEVSARQTIPVQYHYVVESELTEAEKNAVVKELPKFVEENSDAYYLVYRPKTQGLLENNLPRTGYSSLWEATFAVAGLTLAVLVIARGRNGKRYLSSILLVTGLGSILLAPSVFAVTNIELAAYNQRLNLTVGDKLPEPLEITGFEYVGYLKSERQDKVNGERNYQIPTTQKGLSSVEVNKQAGKSVSFSENTSTPNKPVSTETEKLTEQEKAVAVKERESDRRFPVTELPELQLKSQDSTQTQVLPYQTEYQYSSELAEGQSQIIRKGISGTRTVITRNYIAGKEIVKSEVVSDQVTATPISEIILVGTATVKSVPKETPVQEVPELTNYGTTPETAPVHEVPELTHYGTTPETAPVHEVPELTNYGTTPETAPVHEVPGLTNYGTSPDTAPVHEVPELTNYGTTPETAPVHEVPELTNYGTTPETAPVQEAPELAEYGTSTETAPIHETPELTEYGTAPDTAPVHEVPELTNYGTTPETAPVHEVPELTTYGTSPDTAPIYENSELELTTNDEVRIEKIDFSIEEQYTNEIPEGSRKITTPGVQGERTIKTRVYSSNGQEIDRQELSNEETLAPVTQIVKVGTAKPNMIPSEAPKADALPEYPLTYIDETRVEKINFTTREEETDELVRDVRQIATPGDQGERTIKTR